GDAIGCIDLALVKGGVLSGRITDETGDPFPGARVEAIDLRYVRGQRVPLAARVTFTNDAGEYRLSGLESGSYQVRASSTDVWESDDGKNTYVHAMTYFPGVTGGDRPESVALTAGQEVARLEIRLIAGAAARITGVVQDAGGYLFRMNGLPDGWMLKSVMLGDRDLIDQPLAIARGQADLDGLRIVVTKKGAKVTGEVVDAAGAPAPDTTVVVFAENSALWGVASRF